MQHKNFVLRGTIKNSKRLTGYGIGVGSLCLLTYQIEDNRVVANVNGAFRFLRFVSKLFLMTITNSFFRSVRVGLWISIDYYFSMMGLDESLQNYRVMMSRIHQRAADNLLNACLLNGGPYIKLGQGLVSMSHILPGEYINTLKFLQDKCLVREGDELNQIFKEDFGKEPSELFDSLECAPIAAASIAQVSIYLTKRKN